MSEIDEIRKQLRDIKRQLAKIAASTEQEKDRLLTLKEAAPLLAQSVWTIRQQCNRGEIGGIKVGSRWAIKESTLQGIIKSMGT